MSRGGINCMAYFDNAATTFPKPVEVYDFMDKFYRNFGSSFGRSISKEQQTVSKLITDTRNKVKKLLHCENKFVIFTPTATLALNMIIQGILEQNIKNVYITPFEHNAVTRVLEHYTKGNKIIVRQLKVDENYQYDLNSIKYQFDVLNPDLVIMSHASNVTGLVSPVEKITGLSKEYGAVNVVDMAQTAGLIDMNVGLDSIDFAVFAGHKTLYAPQGISGFVMGSGIGLSPIIFGGTGFDSANHEMPNSIPERYEVGTVNTHAISGLYTSLNWIEKIGIENIYEQEKQNRQKLIDILSNYDFVDIVGNNSGLSYVGVVSFVIRGLSSDSAGRIFAENNIVLRTGLHCAPLAHKFLKTFPAGTIRLSTSYFTADEEYEELVAVLDYIEDNL